MDDGRSRKLYLDITIPRDGSLTTGSVAEGQTNNNEANKVLCPTQTIVFQSRTFSQELPPKVGEHVTKSEPMYNIKEDYRIRTRSAYHCQNNYRAGPLQQVQCFDLKEMAHPNGFQYRCSTLKSKDHMNNQVRPRTAIFQSNRQMVDTPSRPSTTTGVPSSRSGANLKPNIIDLNELFNTSSQFPLRYNLKQSLGFGCYNSPYLFTKLFERDRSSTSQQTARDLKKPRIQRRTFNLNYSDRFLISTGIQIRRIDPQIRIDNRFRY